MQYIRNYFFLTLLFSGSFFAAQGVLAAPPYQLSLSCLPDSTGQDVLEQTMMFRCAIKEKSASTKTRVSAILSGKRESDHQESVVSTAEVLLNGASLTEVTLRFPMVLQSGTYQYSFVLSDLETKEPIAGAVSYTRKFSTDRAWIDVVSVDQKQYHWGAPVTLGLSLHIPDEQSLESQALTVDVTMRDSAEKTCATLAERLPVRQAADTYPLRFPEKGSCTNTLVIVLRGKDGTVIDQKTIAVNLAMNETALGKRPVTALSEVGLFGEVSKVLMGGLVLTILVLTILAGYFLFFHRKKRVF